jgi:copper chaperone
MEKIELKTNIKCGGCVAAVKPILDANNQIKHWEVDTQNPQKILTVETETLTGEDVKEMINQAGYKAEIIE